MRRRYSTNRAKGFRRRFARLPVGPFSGRSAVPRSPTHPRGSGHGVAKPGVTKRPCGRGRSSKIATAIGEHQWGRVSGGVGSLGGRPAESPRAFPADHVPRFDLVRQAEPAGCSAGSALMAPTGRARPLISTELVEVSPRPGIRLDPGQIGFFQVNGLLYVERNFVPAPDHGVGHVR